MVSYTIYPSLNLKWNEASPIVDVQWQSYREESPMHYHIIFPSLLAIGRNEYRMMIIVLSFIFYNIQLNSVDCIENIKYDQTLD